MILNGKSSTPRRATHRDFFRCADAIYWVHMHEFMLSDKGLRGTVSVSPLVSAIRTASLRNSSVWGSLIVHLLCCSKCYQRSGIKPRQVHTQRLKNAPRCTATAKLTLQRCQSPPVCDWRVCRVHGAGVGAPLGPTHSNYRQGLRTKEAQSMRRMISVLCKDANETAKEID